MKKIKIIAIVAALLVGIGMYSFLTELAKPKENPKTAVLVAAFDIEANTLITKEMLVVREIDNNYVHPDSVTSMDAAVGYLMGSQVYAGEQILGSRLVPVGENRDTVKDLSYRVDEGMRAISINVTDSSGVANMLRAGDHIDIIISYQYTEDTDTGRQTISASSMCMQDITVLAVDEVMNRERPEENYSVVTLKVTPEQAVVISYGDFTSSLRLVLRSPLDEETITMKDITSKNARNYFKTKAKEDTQNDKGNAD